MLWAKGAGVFFTKPKASKASDAYDLAAAFGDDFAYLLVKGKSPFGGGDWDFLSCPPGTGSIPRWDLLRNTQRARAMAVLQALPGSSASSLDCHRSGLIAVPRRMRRSLKIHRTSSFVRRQLPHSGSQEKGDRSVSIAVPLEGRNGCCA